MRGNIKMNKSDDEIKLIAKLMDESEEPLSLVEKSYNELFNLISNKLPSVLDEGIYTNNSSIIREVIDILKGYEIFTILPELAEKNLIALYGNGRRVSEMLLNGKVMDVKGMCENTNLPMFILNGENTREKIFVLTYMDKVVELNWKEYILLTRELYKRNIEIRKLVKCFIIKKKNDFNKSAFLFFPEYSSLNKEFLGLISENIKEMFLFLDEKNKWIKKLSKQYMSNRKVYIVTDNKEIVNSDILQVVQKVDFLEDKQLRNKLLECNYNNINYMIRDELDVVLVKVIKYYVVNEKAVSQKIERLAKDSVKLSEGEVKKQVIKYRKKLLEDREKNLASRSSFEKVEKEILKRALCLEHCLGDALKHDLSDDYCVHDYIDLLVKLFFMDVEAEKYEKVKDDILRLTRARYPYSLALKCYWKFQQGYELAESDLKKIDSYPESQWEIAKIKISLSEMLNYEIIDLKRMITYIPNKTNGKEWYCLGQCQLDKKQYIEASKSFMVSLSYNYDKAGKELIQLAQKHPECDIDIEELAENLVPEANYYMGSVNINTKYKKGVVNLKMAASKEYIEAIIWVADILYNNYKKISWQKMNDSKNIKAVNNVIELYMYLLSKEDNEKYKLRIGLMYCKLKEYQRAFSFLKDINRPEAQYECAKMHQYGNGVAKNLVIAKEYYSKITSEYKDSNEQYYKVCSQIERESQRKERTNYSESRNYSSSSSTSYSGRSSYCFITTAACIALNETKDCVQLNMLRKFRDEHILGNEGDGALLVKEYYRIGPEIVNKIDQEWNPFAIYSELWEEYIEPSCKCIYIKEWNKAKNIYIMMVKKLCERYQVEVDPIIMKKYDIRIKDKIM